MNDLKITFAAGETNRQCGGCNLCCKLLPMQARNIGIGAVAVGVMTMDELVRSVPNFQKDAGVRCPHQSHAKGCAIYDRRPANCRMWNCRWLVNDDTAELSRPDRSHVVLDIMPDFITLTDNSTGQRRDVPVIQVWVDPKYPEAWRAPSILAYLERRGREGIAALIRYSSWEAFTVFPPALTPTGEWVEHRTGQMVPEHAREQLI